MSSILLKICVYLGCIYLLHQLYQYMTSQLITPTKRNMVQLHQETYNEILEQFKRYPPQASSTFHIPKNDCNEFGEICPGPSLEDESNPVLTDEQKQYLKQSLQHQLDL